jgi:hypothetical protein
MTSELKVTAARRLTDGGMGETAPARQTQLTNRLFTGLLVMENPPIDCRDNHTIKSMGNPTNGKPRIVHTGIVGNQP